MSVSSLLSTTIESSAISAALRVSMDPQGLWAKDAKGTAKKATTINGNIFFIIFSSFLLMTWEAPSETFLRDRYKLRAFLSYIQQSVTHRMFRIVTLLPIVTEKRMDTKYAVKLSDLNGSQFPNQIWNNLFFQEETRSRMLKY